MRGSRPGYLAYLLRLWRIGKGEGQYGGPCCRTCARASASAFRGWRRCLSTCSNVWQNGHPHRGIAMRGADRGLAQTWRASARCAQRRGGQKEGRM